MRQPSLRERPRSVANVRFIVSVDVRHHVRVHQTQIGTGPDAARASAANTVPTMTRAASAAASPGTTAPMDSDLDALDLGRFKVRGHVHVERAVDLRGVILGRVSIRAALAVAPL